MIAVRAAPIVDFMERSPECTRRLSYAIGAAGLGPRRGAGTRRAALPGQRRGHDSVTHASHILNRTVTAAAETARESAERPKLKHRGAQCRLPT
jgi:hypothetical protein